MSKVKAITTDAPTGGVVFGDFELPDPEHYSAKLKTIYSGICGTDRGMVAGSLSFAYNPEGYRQMVLGHEGLAQVLEIEKNNFGIKPGDYVVPIVRRPGKCVNCRMGRMDNCTDGNKHEAGVTGMHGFMRGYFYDTPENLVKVQDKGMFDVAVLAEPLKNVEKAFEVFDKVSERSIFFNDYGTYEDKKAVVIGTGSEAFLFSFFAKDYGFDTVLTNRHPIPDLKKGMVDMIGAEFYDYTMDMDKIAEGGIDLLIDTSGHPGTIFKFARKLNNNGIAILFGTNGKAPPTGVDGSDIDYIIEKNITLLGSVDGARNHYFMALEHLRKWRYVYGDRMKEFITKKISPSDIDIFTNKPENEIKTVIDWSRV
ncbi:glucose 1-dehydrogenase [Oxyplasma meridianum]|uniref:Glucose 1-dehydrogenase n=1 Tax=Oxyplasma meridianum TaxID=3073602 RepID=A0AAX4NG67_9ARCH